MATQRRSVWEIRFYALKHLVTNEGEWEKHKIIETIMDGESPKQEWIDNVKFCNRISKLAREIERKSPKEIFLIRDY